MAGLNIESDFGATRESKLLATHKFAWKPSEFAMIIIMFIVGLLLTFTVKPEFFGISVAVGALWLIYVNQHKKKKSIIELYSTPEGLKLYHNNLLIESASDSKMQIEDVMEVSLTSRDSKEYISLRGAKDEEGNSPYMKIPLRIIQSEEMRKIINNLKSNPNVTINNKIYDTINSIKSKRKKN